MSYRGVTILSVFAFFIVLLASISTMNQVNVAHATYPGTNRKIVFTRNSGGANVTIWTMDANGTNEVQLTSPAPDFPPVWSPDGTKMGFGSRRGGTAGPRAWVMNADGTNIRRLTSDDWAEGRPVWSPDGTIVAYPVGLAAGNFGIVTRAADGSGPITQVTSPPDNANDTVPFFSPDGSKLLFPRTTGSGASATFAVHVVNVDGSGLVNLSGPGVNDVQPGWSPDGTRIVFSNIDGAGQYSVWTMKADGSDRRRVSPVLPTMQQSAPVWSPDGTKILYNRFLKVSPTWSELVVSNPDGTGDTVLTLPAGAGSHNFANWQRIPAQAAPPTSTPTPAATAAPTQTPTSVPTAAPTQTPVAITTPTQSPETPAPTATPPVATATQPPPAPAAPSTGTGRPAEVRDGSSLSNAGFLVLALGLVGTSVLAGRRLKR